MKSIQDEATQFYAHREFVSTVLWRKTFPFFWSGNLSYSSSFQNTCSFAFSPLNLQHAHKAKAFTPCIKARKKGAVWMCTSCFILLCLLLKLQAYFSCINLDSNEFISKVNNFYSNIRNQAHRIESFQHKCIFM